MKIHNRVNVSTLRKKLSYYLRKVKRGKSILVTVRGQIVAILMSVGTPSHTRIVKELSRKGIGSWKGGKPKGASRSISVTGKPVSQIILEERR
jgi:prevent-host-death family protein